MEFKDNWHFVNSEENRVRLSAWTATMFAVDCGWNVSRVGTDLMELPQESYEHPRRNVNFVLDTLPESYQECIAEITQLVFGHSRRHILPTGPAFTVEEVQARQPDTDDFLDVKNLDPKMFATPPADAPPKPATGDGEPNAAASVSITVETPDIVLKSKAKAAPPGFAGPSSMSYRPQMPASSVGENVEGYVKSYWMEDHLPEYQYTMVTNSEGNEMLGILFNGVAYELELLGASDVETLAKQIHVDKRFADFAARVNKVCRGIASCSKVPMDKDLFIDLEAFAKAFRKEVPPDVFITVSNLFGVAMKMDRHGNSRFQFLCARIPELDYDNNLGTISIFVPVKIRAIQGHSAESLKRAEGLFANSVQIYCAANVSPERKAAFAGVPIYNMTEVLDVAFHRTMKSNWKSIAKSGRTPGGGDSVNSGRAHVYLSEARYGADGYRSGLRGQCPIEIKVALKQAVHGGVIFGRTGMDGIITSKKIPPQFIVSISDGDKVLWTRAEINLKPTSWQAAETSTSPTSGVRLVARDDAVLLTMSQWMTPAQGNLLLDPQQKPTPLTTESDQPPPRVRRVYIAPRHAEPFTGECPLCFVEYVSGQVVCSTCGYEPLPMDESGQTKRQTNRRTKVLEKRMQKLAEFGMYGEVNSTLLATLTGEQADLLRQEIGERGITSLESSVLKDCRDRCKRAKQLGYENVEDRYSCDVTFCDRVHEDGRGLNDCIFDDMFAFENLPDPPRTRAQVSAGVAANAEHANCLSKLICMSQPAGVDGFPVEYRGTWTKVWGFMFGRPIFNETEYVSYIGRNSYRQLLTWKGIVQVPFDGTLNFLEKIYEENLPVVGGNLGRKEKQSIAAKANPPKADPQIERKRKAEEEGNAPMGTEAASSSAREQKPHPVPHHFFCQILQHHRAAQDHFWSQSP